MPIYTSSPPGPRSSCRDSIGFHSRLIHRFATSPPLVLVILSLTLDTTMTREIGLHAEINHALPYRFAAWMSFPFFVLCSFRRGTERTTSKKLTRKWKALSSSGWERWSFDNDGLLDDSSKFRRNLKSVVAS